MKTYIDYINKTNLQQIDDTMIDDDGGGGVGRGGLKNNIKQLDRCRGKTTTFYG